MRLLVEVTLGSKAMQSALEAGRAIKAALVRQVPDPLASLTEGQMGSIRDENGNGVGRWEVVGHA